MAETGIEMGRPRIAVLVPCFNEAQTIAQVVRDFREALSGAAIYVYDNNSTDETASNASAAGAIVRNEPRRGKGNVVRRMLSDVEAEIYVLVDGDGTYDAASAGVLVERLIEDKLDLVNGARLETTGHAYRRGHLLGNKLLTSLVRLIFGSEFKDMLSGLKVCSRRFAKSFPALSEGFEIESEMTIHALESRMPVSEIDVPYRERQPGSISKLSTISDGMRILKTISLLIKEEKPLQFFAILFFASAGLSLILGVPLIDEFIDTGLVPRFPTAILASGLMILAFISIACGLILDTVSRGQRELKRMHYLAIASVENDKGSLL